MEFIKQFRRMAYKNFEDDIDLSTARVLLEDFIKLNLREKLHKIKKDVYIIHGKEDRVVPLECGVSLHRAIKGSKFIQLAGGHLPHGYESVILKILKSV